MQRTVTATVWRKQLGQEMAKPAEDLLTVHRRETKDGGDVLFWGSFFTRSTSMALWLHRGLSGCLMFPVSSVSTNHKGHPLWACHLVAIIKKSLELLHQTQTENDGTFCKRFPWVQKA